MIRHTVVFRLKHATDSAEERQFLLDALCLAAIAGVEKFEQLRQTSPKNDFRFGFSMEFADAAVYDAYSDHPVHVQFVEERWIPEVEEFMIPVPFPHEDNARELGLQMRDETIRHLKAGGVIILFPAGKVAMSEGWWGPAVEGEWNVFTHKIVKSTGATILPIYFPGQNSRLFQIANQVSDTVRQGLLLYEIKRCLFKPTRPVIGEPIPAEELKKWEGNPRGFLAWLREHTLALKNGAL